ncbi:MAG: SMI1/KNR4 family protein [Planctomycetia bacterium]|nr:SMI1/KNR4 family protein [Planctomycetia bacterium]
MSDEAAFLAAIANAPDDDALRLVYADWLEEHGKPGSNFLRAEHELTVLPLGQAEWHAAFARYQSAGKTLSEAWCRAAGRHQAGYWLAVAARSAWNRIETWCQRHCPGLVSVFNLGATAEEIDAIERAIGQTLPTDVRESFAIHNGAGRFLFGDEMLTAEDVVRRWQVWREVEDYNEEFRDNMKSFPERAIALAYTVPGWIPLTSDGGGNHLGVDLTPGPAGTIGQVINFGRDEEHKCVLASGWAEFLADFATFLESGAVSSDNATASAWIDCCRAAMGDRHHHDALREWRQNGRWPPRQSQ